MQQIIIPYYSVKWICGILNFAYDGEISFDHGLGVIFAEISKSMK